MVLRGLPSGQYKWRMDYGLGADRTTHQEGEFQLVPVSSEP